MARPILSLTALSSEPSWGVCYGVTPIQWKGNLGVLPEGQGDGQVPAVGVQGQRGVPSHLSVPQLPHWESLYCHLTRWL